MNQTTNNNYENEPTKIESISQEEKYEKILDNLFKISGGKEYCLQQILTEFDYNQFSKEYRNTNRNSILKKIKDRFYEQGEFNSDNIIDIEISKTCWNKHVMKLYFYDTVNFKMFEYYVKTDQVESVSLFTDNDKIYAKSFFPKIRNGNTLWENYRDFIEKDSKQKEIERALKDQEFFLEKSKHLKYLDIIEFDKLTAIKAPDQYTDGIVRYLVDGQYYYLISRVNGFLTFSDKEDLLLNRGFSALFFKKIMQKIN